jgi:hypothetical protein
MVKKLLVVALAAAAAKFVLAKRHAGQAEQNLWAEATDPVQPGR